MDNKKFAFESDEVSIAFVLTNGLGDCITAKKVFNALIELAPDCRIDIFCAKENHKAFAKSFYSDSMNLNLIGNLNELYERYVKNYDLSVHVVGYNFITLYGVNVQKLSTEAPKLLEGIIKVDQYNKRYVRRLSSFPLAVPLIHMTAAQIVNKNCYAFLSCDGALPIYNDKVNIPLLPEFKPQFDALNLDKYITIYTDITKSEEARPKVKTWPIKYFVEYIARMKKRFPNVEIVQCGGANDVKVKNADRWYLGVDLELTKYLLANSLLHVGCEGGLIHLATQLGTKCLVLFSASSVHYYGYDQNINLVSEVCSPCMYLFGDGSINFCIRGNIEPPCMLSHTPQTVCEVTCNYLKNKA